MATLLIGFSYRVYCQSGHASCQLSERSLPSCQLPERLPVRLPVRGGSLEITAVKPDTSQSFKPCIEQAIQVARRSEYLVSFDKAQRASISIAHRTLPRFPTVKQRVCGFKETTKQDVHIMDSYIRGCWEHTMRTMGDRPIQYSAQRVHKTAFERRRGR